MIRPTRIALGVPVGLLAVGFGVASHGLHAVHLGPGLATTSRASARSPAGWRCSRPAVVAAAAPRRRRGAALGWRAAHARLAAGGAVVGLMLVRDAARRHRAGHPRAALGDPGVRARHPARGGPHPAADGRELAAWYVPSRNGAAVAAGPRLRRQPRARRRRTSACSPATATACWRSTSRATARATATPTASATTPSRRIDAGARLPRAAARRRSDRIAGFGALARRRGPARGGRARHRLAAVVSDGAARPEDADKARAAARLERVVRRRQARRRAGDLRHARRRPRCTPLIAADRARARCCSWRAAATRRRSRPTASTRERGGPTTPLWELPDVRPHRRPPRTPGRLRAAHDRLPRPRAQGAAGLAFRRACQGRGGGRGGRRGR